MDHRKPFETATPEALGIRSGDIMAYLDALEASNTEMHGLMIMRHGKLCAQGWWAPFGPGVRADNGEKLTWYVRGGWNGAVAESWNGAVVTEPVPVREMHAWHKENPDAFIAAIRD